MQSINERLFFIYKELGCNASELARRCNVSASYMGSVVKGKNKINLEIVAGVVKMGYRAEWFLSGEGEMFVSDDSKTKSVPVVGSLDAQLANLEPEQQLLVRSFINQLELAKKARDNGL